jgi:hypothetical protein
MTIDIFQKDGTAHGIFVVERGMLFIALAKLGAERPTRFNADFRGAKVNLNRARRASVFPQRAAGCGIPGQGAFLSLAVAAFLVERLPPP